MCRASVAALKVDQIVKAEQVGQRADGTHVRAFSRQAAAYEDSKYSLGNRRTSDFEKNGDRVVLPRGANQ
jgi:hypothetical protein